MTCNNDPETLEKVLSWGAEEGRIAIRWEHAEEENGSKPDKSSVKKRVINDENPILWSAQQGYTQCTKLLHQHGFRIPQTRGEAVLEGDKEAVREKEVVKDPSNGDDNNVGEIIESNDKGRHPLKKTGFFRRKSERGGRGSCRIQNFC